MIRPRTATAALEVDPVHERTISTGVIITIREDVLGPMVEAAAAAAAAVVTAVVRARRAV